MRGKGSFSCRTFDHVRITPAYAGKRSWRNMTQKLKADHPRLCGEKQAFYKSRQWEAGSPPPMRGKAKKPEIASFSPEITPAYAGKSACKTAVQVGSRDHPRLCGEKFFQIKINWVFEGSPPPMRGKANIGDDIGDDFRITPAYAGKSRHAAAAHVFREDHPRLCGEKGFGLFPQPLHTGSPPPMRGKVYQLLFPGQVFGITPAYAGKSRSADRWSSVCEDHPRLCGEKLVSR